MCRCSPHTRTQTHTHTHTLLVPFPRRWHSCRPSVLKDLSLDSCDQWLTNQFELAVKKKKRKNYGSYADTLLANPRGLQEEFQTVCRESTEVRGVAKEATRIKEHVVKNGSDCFWGTFKGLIRKGFFFKKKKRPFGILFCGAWTVRFSANESEVNVCVCDTDFPLDTKSAAATARRFLS